MPSPCNPLHGKRFQFQRDAAGFTRHPPNLGLEGAGERQQGLLGCEKEKKKPKETGAFRMMLQSGSGLRNSADVQMENVAPVFPLVLLITRGSGA